MGHAPIPISQRHGKRSMAFLCPETIDCQGIWAYYMVILRSASDGK